MPNTNTFAASQTVSASAATSAASFHLPNRNYKFSLAATPGYDDGLDVCALSLRPALGFSREVASISSHATADSFFFSFISAPHSNWLTNYYYNFFFHLSQFDLTPPTRFFLDTRGNCNALKANCLATVCRLIRTFH